MTNSKTADKLPVTAKTGMPHSVLSVALLSITLLTGCAEKMAHEKTAPKAEQAVQSHPQHHAQLNEVLVSAPSSRPTRSQQRRPPPTIRLQLIRALVLQVQYLMKTLCWQRKLRGMNMNH